MTTQLNSNIFHSKILMFCSDFPDLSQNDIPKKISLNFSKQQNLIFLCIINSDFTHAYSMIIKAWQKHTNVIKMLQEIRDIWCLPDSVMDWKVSFLTIGHPELYCKSKEAILDYKGDTVTESILGQGTACPLTLFDPPIGTSRTDKEIWKREVSWYVNAKANVDKGLKQVYMLMWVEVFREVLWYSRNWSKFCHCVWGEGSYCPGWHDLCPGPQNNW